MSFANLFVAWYLFLPHGFSPKIYHVSHSPVLSSPKSQLLETQSGSLLPQMKDCGQRYACQPPRWPTVILASYVKEVALRSHTGWG